MHCARPIKLPTSSGNVGGGLPTATDKYVNISGISGIETGGTNPVVIVIRSGGSSGPVVATLSITTSGAANAPINHPVKVACPVYAQIIGSGTPDASIHVL